MKIALLLPSHLMNPQYEDRIFAPKDLYHALVKGLREIGHTVVANEDVSTGLTEKGLASSQIFLQKGLVSVKDWAKENREELASVRMIYEYELSAIREGLLKAVQEKVDIVHLYLGYSSGYMLDLLPFPFVTTLHDPVFPKNTFEYQRMLLFREHNFVAISRSQQQLYQQEYGIEIRSVIPHGIDSNAYPFGEEGGESLVFLGRYIPEKGVEDAMLAAQAVLVPLQLATSGNYKSSKYYQQQIKPKLTSLITEVPFLQSIADKVPFLQSAKALIFPTKFQEPFGMVVIEALSTGTPVIAYANGALTEIIQDGKTGFLVNSSEEERSGDWVIKQTGREGLQEAIKALYSLPTDHYKEMRRAARQSAREAFSLEKMVGEYENLYQSIIRNPS